MTEPAAFRQADVERVIRALKAVGEKIVAVERTPEGGFRVLTASAEESKPRTSELERWRQNKRGRSAA